MFYEVAELNQTKAVLEGLVQGINPLTGKPLERENLLRQGELVKYLKNASAIVEQLIRNGGRLGGSQGTPFTITPEQKKAVCLPEGKIGVNEFSRCVNACLEPEARKLTGVELNKRLKKLGILSEEKLEENKTRTIVNALSAEYGFESEERTYQNEKYLMVLMNDQGKKYLLDNLETIMAAELKEAKNN